MEADYFNGKTSREWDMSVDQLALLRTIFGFESFRPGQREAIHSLAENRHTLVVMPTGAGKSLIFQLMAIQAPGITLVISPLISLMQDQVDSLNRRQIPATYINSSLPAAEQNQRLQQLARGKYRLVYVAPERLRSKGFLAAMKSQTISLLAVDEAHCISEWGHDFRPDYLNIAFARTSLGQPLTVALTATATPRVQEDILKLLGLQENSSNCIVTGFNRPNLSLNILYTTGETNKLRQLKAMLRGQSSGSTIIYTGTRRDAEVVAEFVRDLVKLPAEHYHAGLPAAERTRIQNDFMSGKLNLIAATNAFGMGIDRSDVRRVIHYSLPGSLEAYYQEAGRAGRDGKASCASLLYDPADRALHEFFIKQSELADFDLRKLHKALPSGQGWITIDELSGLTGLHPVQVKVGLSALERAGAMTHLGDEGLRLTCQKGAWDPIEIEIALRNSAAHLKVRANQLSAMVQYAESNECRRRIILNHFGDSGTPEAADCCDNCRTAATVEKPLEKGDFSPEDRLALIILDCIQRMKIKGGKRKVSQILHGSTAQDILAYHHDRNIYYARLAGCKQRDIERVILQLVESGHIKSIGGEYPVLNLTRKGESAVLNKEHIGLKIPKSIDLFSLGRGAGKPPAGGSPPLVSRLAKLGNTMSQAGIPELIEALESPDGNVRRVSASALGKLRTPRAVDPLLSLLEKERKPQVRQYTVKALGSIGDRRAAAALGKIAANGQEVNYVRTSARLALSLISHTAESRPNPDAKLAGAIPAPAEGLEESVDAYLRASHPRALTGPWACGWSLGFHSHFNGSEWSRSGVGSLTYRLKYEGDVSVVPELVAQTLELGRLHPELFQVDTILPVPPSNPRPMDPVQVFCTALAQSLNCPVLNNLSKTRRTEPQKGLKTLAQKRDNVRGAFALSSGLKGKRVLLIDDLFDSGATLEEITRLLTLHRASRINVLTLTCTIHSDK